MRKFGLIGHPLGHSLSPQIHTRLFELSGETVDYQLYDIAPEELAEKYDFYIGKFKSQLENDLNTSNALSILYELLKDNEVNGKTKIELIQEFDKVLALNLCVDNTELSNELDAEIEKLIKERAEAKKNKDFSKADKIRDDLLQRGIKLIDTREGTSYEIIKD